MTAIASGLEERLAAVRGRIVAACERAGRDPAGVRLVGVTKGMAAAAVVEALRAGIADIGENLVQEAKAKLAAVGEHRATWRLIGHLQTNKVRDALATFDVIESVDSLRLAARISSLLAEGALTSTLSQESFESLRMSREPGTPTRRVPVFLEVNVAAEASKFGFRVDEVGDAVKAVREMPNVDLRGLMTVAPAVKDAESVRPVFRTLREVAAANGLAELSMGMSHDFEVAIEEGATSVRVGRALFGERTA